MGRRLDWASQSADRRPGFQRWAAAFPLTKFIARRARARCSTSAPASCIRRSCSPACAWAFSTCWPKGQKRSSRSRPRWTCPRKRPTACCAPRPRCGCCAPYRGTASRSADLGASLRGNPSIAAFIEHHSLLYDDLRDPVALLRGRGLDEAVALLALFRGAATNRRTAGGGRCGYRRDAVAGPRRL